MVTSARSIPVPAQRGAFSRLWRAVRQLFHEMIGAIFGVLALAWLNAAFRAWSADVAYWMVAMAVCVAGLFVFFAVSSFLRARRL